MYAQMLSDGWTVCDPAGGRWYPNADASIEIDESDDPESTALLICETTPTRGVWVQ